MAIYVVFSNYFRSGVFGTYSSVKRARIAFEHFLAEDEENGETFGAEICHDVLDYEFVEGICKED